MRIIIQEGTTASECTRGGWSYLCTFRSIRPSSLASLILIFKVMHHLATRANEWLLHSSNTPFYNALFRTIKFIYRDWTNFLQLRSERYCASLNHRQISNQISIALGRQLHAPASYNTLIRMMLSLHRTNASKLTLNGTVGKRLFSIMWHEVRGENRKTVGE